MDVTIKIVESKKFFKLTLENDVRIKTIANKLCHLMHLDPYATEWAFYVDGESYYEIPIIFTLNQVEFKGGRFLLAKIMTTTMRNQYFETIEMRLLPVSEWYSKCKVQTENMQTQTEKVEGLDVPLKKKQVIYTIDGTFRQKKTFFKHSEPRDIGDIWERLSLIEENRIMRGLNLVAYCRNERCINYHRWISVSIGFGR